LYYWVSYSNGDTYQERTSDGTLYSWDDNTNGWVLTFETGGNRHHTDYHFGVGTADPTDPNSSNPGPTSCTTGVVWGSIVQFAGTAVGMPVSTRQRSTRRSGTPLPRMPGEIQWPARSPLCGCTPGKRRLVTGGRRTIRDPGRHEGIPVIGWLATGLMIIQGGMAGYEYFENNIGSCP